MPLAAATLTGLAVAVMTAPRRDAARLAAVLGRSEVDAGAPSAGPGKLGAAEAGEGAGGRTRGGSGALRRHGAVRAPGHWSPTAGPVRRRPGPVLACWLAAGALVLVLGRLGLLLGLGVLLLGPSLLRSLEPRHARAERERFTADLPLALELLGACLAGGAALLPAVRAVAAATPGPCGTRLMRVASALEVGLPPADAWARLTEPAPDPGPGRAGGGPVPEARGSRTGAGAVPPSALAASAVRALARAGDAGTPAAAAVARLAAQARVDRSARGQAAAERAGVLAVAPLGLCFLPAFVLLGVVPVIAGLVGPLLAGF